MCIALLSYLLFFRLFFPFLVENEKISSTSSKYGRYQVKKKRKPSHTDVSISEKISSPKILFCHDEERLMAMPFVSRFWEKMRCEPYGGRKNIIASFGIIPCGGNGQRVMREWMTELAVVYQVS